MRLITIPAVLLSASVAFAQGDSRTQHKSGAQQHHGEAADRVIDMKTVKGESAGRAQIIGTPHGVLIRYSSENLPPGIHAIHLHETGRCDAPDFESAGDHFNPTKAMHGFANEKGHHAGDLPNIHTAAGRQTHELFVNGVMLSSGTSRLLDGDGAALVVHAGIDDHATDPAGDSGDRIACGVVQ